VRNAKVLYHTSIAQSETTRRTTCCFSIGGMRKSAGPLPTVHRGPDCRSVELEDSVMEETKAGINNVRVKENAAVFLYLGKSHVHGESRAVRPV
jgi:hypothetical protein